MKKVINEVEVTLDVIGGKWKSLILYHLMYEGVKRYSEIESFLTNISHKTLATQLKALEKDGLVKREAFPCVPPYVEYSLTDKGETLRPVLDALCDWGNENKDSYELLNPYCLDE